MSKVGESPSMPEFQASPRAEAGAMGEKRISRLIPKHLSILVSKVAIPVGTFINNLRGRSASDPPKPVSSRQVAHVTVQKNGPEAAQRQRAASAPPKPQLTNEERQEKAVDALKNEYPEALLKYLAPKIKFARTDYPPTVQLNHLAYEYMKDKVDAQVKEKVTNDINAEIRNNPTLKISFREKYNNHPDILKALNIPKSTIDEVYEAITNIDTISQNRLHGG